MTRNLVLKEGMGDKIVLNSFSIKIHDPIDSELAILQFEDVEREKFGINIMIENIGPGGLRIVSSLFLKDGQKIVYSFENKRLDDQIHLPGSVIWREELSEGLYQYGIHFDLSESERNFLTHFLKDIM